MDPMMKENGEIVKKENSEGENNLNGWLPVTANREGKWWYAAIHSVTGMVGAGILGLPYAMSQLGWGPGVTLLLVSWAITLYTLWQMIELHEAVPGKRFDRYHELGQYAFGEKLGLWVIVPQQFMVQAGCDIVYMVTGGSSLMKFYNIVHPNGPPIKLTYFIMIYSAIAWIASLIKGVQPDTSYASRYNTSASQIFGFLSGIGTVAFAFSGHNIVLEIQATIPTSPENPSKKAMWKGFVEDNVMISLQNPNWLIAAANLFVVIHVIGSYQVYAIPVFDMLESFMVLKMKFQPSRKLRIITRGSYVGITMFIGIAFPFFGSLLSVLGGIAFAPTSFYAFIIFGMSLTILAPIGAIRDIVVQCGTFKFFS
uniref:Amino acid transporter transmembrane domain-containing protein n=1 Tax=Chenopodium quinoa TaxID=63459 RepID=A0A803L7S8_CHEQI